MKTLSLWQPYAQLIAIGEKQYETRSWTTAYRGEIAIHASKKRSKELLLLSRDEPFRHVMVEAGYEFYTALPFGAIIATARLTAIYRTEKLVPHLSFLEEAFGNFAPGRFAWRLENVKLLPEPIFYPGQQGLFDWNPEPRKQLVPAPVQLSLFE